MIRHWNAVWDTFCTVKCIYYIVLLFVLFIYYIIIYYVYNQQLNRVYDDLEMQRSFWVDFLKYLQIAPYVPKYSIFVLPARYLLPKWFFATEDCVSYENTAFIMFKTPIRVYGIWFDLRPYIKVSLFSAWGLVARCFFCIVYRCPF